jgi:hypothetical protein
MSWWLRLHQREYQFLELHEVRQGVEPMVFRHPAEAGRLVRRLSEAPGNTVLLRAIAERVLHRNDLYRFGDYDVAGMVAEALSTTRLLVIELPRPEISGLPAATGEERERLRVAEPSRKTWIKIVLVDESGRPVPGVRYQVPTPGGAVVGRGTLGETGQVRIDGIDPGACQVTFPDLDQAVWSRQR